MELEINHQLLYRRKTHDEKGEYRNLPNWDKIPDHIGGLIHYLRSNHWINLYDVMSEIYKYAACYPFENDCHEFGNPHIIQANLKFLAEVFDIVEIKNNGTMENTGA